PSRSASTSVFLPGPRRKRSPDGGRWPPGSRLREPEDAAATGGRRSRFHCRARAAADGKRSGGERRGGRSPHPAVRRPCSGDSDRVAAPLERFAGELSCPLRPLDQDLLHAIEILGELAASLAGLG